eukprot:2287829-Rhodomonas_salina.2
MSKSQCSIRFIVLVELLARNSYVSAHSSPKASPDYPGYLGRIPIRWVGIPKEILPGYPGTPDTQWTGIGQGCISV